MPAPPTKITDAKDMVNPDGPGLLGLARQFVQPSTLVVMLRLAVVVNVVGKVTFTLQLALSGVAHPVIVPHCVIVPSASIL